MVKINSNNSCYSSCHGLLQLGSSCKINLRSHQLVVYWMIPTFEFQMAESESDGVLNVTPPHTPLISGLLEDIALFCLARVSQRKHSLDETWIYALCRDKSDQVSCYVLDPNSSRRSWKLIPSIPSRCLKRKGIAFEVLGKKLYLLGRCVVGLKMQQIKYSTMMLPRTLGKKLLQCLLPGFFGNYNAIMSYQQCFLPPHSKQF